MVKDVIAFTTDAARKYRKAMEKAEAAEIARDKARPAVLAGSENRDRSSDPAKPRDYERADSEAQDHLSRSRRVWLEAKAALAELFEIVQKEQERAEAVNVGNRSKHFGKPQYSEFME